MKDKEQVIKQFLSNFTDLHGHIYLNLSLALKATVVSILINGGEVNSVLNQDRADCGQILLCSKMQCCLSMFGQFVHFSTSQELQAKRSQNTLRRFSTLP